MLHICFIQSIKINSGKKQKCVYSELDFVADEVLIISYDGHQVIFPSRLDDQHSYSELGYPLFSI